MAAGRADRKPNANAAVSSGTRSIDLLPSAGVLLLLLGWPPVAAPADIYLRVFGLACFYGALAMAWNLVALTGLLSLGHAAFFGLGAYGAALADHYWQLPPFAAIGIGAVLGAAYGGLWMATFRRLRGAAFALATLASVEIPKVIIDNWDAFTFGSLGVVGISRLPTLDLGGRVLDFGTSLTAQYYLLLLFLVVVGGFHFAALHSRWGWAIRAVREDETAAAALGVNVPAVRAQALLLSALLTALGGGLYAHLMGLIEPPLVFSLHLSALPLVLTIFGGRYRAFGPVLGALVLYPADQLLFHRWLPSGHALLYGLVIVIALLFCPRGIAAWLSWNRRSAWKSKTSG